MLSREGPNGLWRRLAVFLVPLAVVAIMSVFAGSSIQWPDIAFLVVAGVIGLLCEFVLRRKMRLPWSRECPVCGARSRQNASKCISCEREFRAPALLHSPAADLVPASQQAGRVAKVGMVVLAIAMYVACFAFLQIGVRSAGIFAVLWLVLYGYDFMRWLFLRRLVKRLEMHAGAICTACSYPLDQSMIQCPECGTVGKADDAKRDWLSTGLWLPESLLKPAAAATSSSPSP